MQAQIPVGDIDEIFQLQLEAFLTDTNLSKYRDQSETEIQEKEKLLKVARDERLKLSKKMKTLLEMRFNGKLSKDLFAVHYKPIEERFLQLEAQLPEPEAEIDFRKIQRLSSQTVLQDAKDLYTQWPTFPFEQKRAIAETITEKIVIDTEDITISLA